MYAKFLKRLLDFGLSFVALVILSPLLLVLMILGAIIMKGNPFFLQLRPGKDEKIFKLVKLRTMTNARDKEGNLLPDEKRLTRYGRMLRASSLDELPELVNILKGDMALVGPRPQLVRDMVFMTEEQRKRHTVRQGLTGLAQVSGRNSVSWEKKFEYDLQYIENITFWGDLKILFKTVTEVLHCNGVTSDGMETAEDFGDYLLRTGKILQAEYDLKQAEADRLIESVK